MAISYLYLPLFSALLNFFLNWEVVICFLVSFEILSISIFIIFMYMNMMFFLFSVLLLVLSSLLSFIFILTFVRSFGKEMSKSFSF